MGVVGADAEGTATGGEVCDGAAASCNSIFEVLAE